MPRGDGTGPEGLGPMTGRGAGYCSGFNRPGRLNNRISVNRRFYRRGRGSRINPVRGSGRRGRGPGRGLRR